MLLSVPTRMHVSPWRGANPLHRVVDVWITAPDGSEYLLRAGCATNHDGHPTGRPCVSGRGRLNRHTGAVVPSKRTAKLLEPVENALSAFLTP